MKVSLPHPSWTTWRSQKEEIPRGNLAPGPRGLRLPTQKWGEAVDKAGEGERVQQRIPTLRDLGTRGTLGVQEILTCTPIWWVPKVDQGWCRGGLLTSGATAHVPEGRGGEGGA